MAECQYRQMLCRYSQQHLMHVFLVLIAHARYDKTLPLPEILFKVISMTLVCLLLIVRSPFDSLVLNFWPQSESLLLLLLLLEEDCGQKGKNIYSVCIHILIHFEL